MSDSTIYHDTEMVVHWGDCDPAGISYYAKSFDWFTNGRMAFLSYYHLPYMETFQNSGISLVCLSADCQYKKMLRPLEDMTIRTMLTTLTRTRMAFLYQILKTDGTLACEGTTTHAYIDENGAPFNVEKRYPTLWKELTEKLGTFQQNIMKGGR